MDDAVATALQALTVSRKTHSARADGRVAVLYERLRLMRRTGAVNEFEDAYRSTDR